MNILFVCAGNTCRSPMAAALCRMRHPELDTRSRGMAAAPRLPATDHAKTIAAEYGASLEDHVAVPMDAEVLQWADRVYVMTDVMADCFRERFPQAADKVSTLPCGNVEDPYGRDLDAYRRTAETLLRGIDAL